MAAHVHQHAAAGAAHVPEPVRVRAEMAFQLAHVINLAEGASTISAPDACRKPRSCRFAANLDPTKPTRTVTPAPSASLALPPSLPPAQTPPPRTPMRFPRTPGSSSALPVPRSDTPRPR